jgi:hypothetical protein
MKLFIITLLDFIETEYPFSTNEVEHGLINRQIPEPSPNRVYILFVFMNQDIRFSSATHQFMTILPLQIFSLSEVSL